MSPLPEDRDAEAALIVKFQYGPDQSRRARTHALHDLYFLARSGTDRRTDKADEMTNGGAFTGIANSEQNASQLREYRARLDSP
jgi:hypothetical protein